MDIFRSYNMHDIHGCHVVLLLRKIMKCYSFGKVTNVVHGRFMFVSSNDIFHFIKNIRHFYQLFIQKQIQYCTSSRKAKV